MFKPHFSSLTINGKLSFLRIGRTKMIGNDALVASLVGKSDMAQVQNGSILYHHPIPGTDVGKVLHLGMVQNLTVLLPGKSHRRAAATGCGARQANVFAKDSDGSFWFNNNFGFGKIV